MTTNVAPSAGSNSLPPPKLAQPAIMNPHLPWYLVIPSFLENSVRLSAPSKKAASSKLPKAGSPLEAAFARQIRALKLPEPIREYRFDAERRWRFDFAWPESRHMVAVELEGGIWNNGRHSRATGFIADCEKYNAAQLAGWTVLRFTAEHLKSGEAIEWTRQALGL